MTNKITFTLPAQLLDNATSALLLGDFNNWDLNSGSYLSKCLENHKVLKPCGFFIYIPF